MAKQRQELTLCCDITPSDRVNFEVDYEDNDMFITIASKDGINLTLEDVVELYTFVGEFLKDKGVHPKQ